MLEPNKMKRRTDKLMGFEDANAMPGGSNPVKISLTPQERYTGRSGILKRRRWSRRSSGNPHRKNRRPLRPQPSRRRKWK